jgi:hypothetical protein
MARTSTEHRAIQAHLELRMLSGEPFIYGRLSAWAEAGDLCLLRSPRPPERCPFSLLA